MERRKNGGKRSADPEEEGREGVLAEGKLEQSRLRKRD